MESTWLMRKNAYIFQLFLSDEELSLTDIHKRLNKHPANLGYLIKRMTENKLIKVKKSGRKSLVTLTAKGKSLAPHFNIIIHGHNHHQS